MKGKTPDAAATGGVLYASLRRLIDVRAPEVPALAWSWLYIFAVLSSYYIMRPIRDQMGVAGGVHNLQWLFTGTLIGMMLLNVPFAYLVKKLPRSRFIPIAYRFFALNILVFAVILHYATPAQTIWVGRIFFIWISIYNLFVVSIFWALIVDIFNSEQGKRLFGFIAAGATIGAIVGSGLTASLARYVPIPLLLIASVILLELAVFAVGRLSKLSASLSKLPQGERVVGGSIWAGITHPFKSLYLGNLGIFMLLFTIVATFLYFEQAAIVKENFKDRGAQTAFFATVDLAVNAITLILQLFFTGRIIRWLGVGLTLTVMPLICILGFGTLAFFPTVAAIVAFQVLRRSGEYAIVRPTREVLYTVVPREDRYKAKSFIDTVVYRGGDQLGAWTYAGFAALGLGLSAIALVSVALSALWLINGFWLGKKQEALAAAEKP